MRLTFTTILLLAGFVSFSQDINIKRRDTTTFSCRVIASSPKGIRTSKNETILFSEMVEVTFKNYVPKRDDILVDRLKTSGVKISDNVPEIAYAGSETARMIEPRKDSVLIIQKPVTPVLKKMDTTKVSLDQVVASLENFRKEREGAKIFQLIGAAAISATLIVNSIADKQAREDLKSGAVSKTGYTAPSYMPNAVPIGGALLLTIGVAVDIGAGSKLRLKMK